MSKLGIIVLTAATMVASGAMPVRAENLGNDGSASLRPLHITRSGPSLGIWFFDGRDDTRDFPTNGFFPGDFAADPANAAIGAAGLFGSTPSRAFDDAPLQAGDGLQREPGGSQRDPGYCARRYRSYDPASGTYLGNDHARHRC